MNFLNKDLVFYLGLRLDPCEILKFSQASKKCNQILCSNNLFWRSKLLKDYFSEDEIYDTDFKELYKKMYENKYAIVEDHFNEFSKFDWKKYLINLYIEIRYYVYAQKIHFSLIPQYNDGYRDYKFSLPENFQQQCVDKLQYIFERKKGYELNSQHKREKYNKIFTTEDIYDLFHPLLLHSLKQYNIAFKSMDDRDLIPNNFYQIVLIYI